MSSRIGICLATFNGARFLGEQLASLEAQTMPDWHLYIRDDGSSDGTLDAIKAFMSRHPARTTHVCDDLGRLGPSGNFSLLAQGARHKYTAFADQDDVWRPDRLAKCLARLRALEASCTPGTPAMVHADRRLIDHAGYEIAPSYWGSRAIGPKDFDRLERHYTFCFAAGSTMLINSALKDLALPIPPDARMYDCWIELVAHAFGSVDAIDEPLVAHRRHGGNATGPTQSNDSPGARRPAARARRLLGSLPTHRNVAKQYFAQAMRFRARYGHLLGHTARRRLDMFLSMPDARRVYTRLRLLHQSRADAPGLARALVFAAVSAQSDAR